MRDVHPQLYRVEGSCPPGQQLATASGGRQDWEGKSNRHHQVLYVSWTSTAAEANPAAKVPMPWGWGLWSVYENVIRMRVRGYVNR
jgi:hypothetical protein